MKILASIIALIGLPGALTIAAPDIDVQKSVDNAFPMLNEPVEFTVLVNNIGDEAAADVVVIDQLPAQMGIPPGTSAFASVGHYDVVTGEWTIGNLGPGAGATLVVPATITAAQPSDCIVNRATLQMADIPDDSFVEARAAVHQNSVDRCVDLDVNFGISSGPIFSSCDQFGQYAGGVDIFNFGPDAARDVVITLGLHPDVAPNVRFHDTDCSNAPGIVCNIGEIAPGEVVNVDVTSDSYQSYNSFTQEVSIGVTTTDTDYDSSNDHPTVTGTGRAFSSCDSVDPGIPPVFFGPGTVFGPGCFIATAAYGSSLDSRLDVLRGFRDRHMMTNGPGRAMVAFYYRHSPAMADIVAERGWLRAIVRGVLAPIVFAIQYPVWGLLSFIGLIGFVIATRRQWRRILNGVRARL